MLPLFDVALIISRMNPNIDPPQIHLKKFIIPDDKYCYHHVSLHDFNESNYYGEVNTDYYNTYYYGHIVRINDFLKIIDMQKQHNNSSDIFDHMIETIPYGVNCFNSQDLDELVSNGQYFVNAESSLKTYLNKKGIDDTLCFVLTTSQYNDLLKVSKYFKFVPEVVECWYDKKLSGQKNYVCKSNELTSLLKIPEIQKDELVQKLLKQAPLYKNYVWASHDSGAIIKTTSYETTKHKIYDCCNKIGLYPWCELVLTQNQIDLLKKIMEKYSYIKINMEELKRNCVVMLRNNGRGVHYHKKYNHDCVLL